MEHMFVPGGRVPSADEFGGCAFCDALAAGPNADWWNRPLLETANFVVWPSLGALVPGWLLIVAKRHFVSLARAEPVLHAELENLVPAVSGVLQDIYALPVTVFEHGPCLAGDPVGCTTDHAHLHAVPLDFDVPLGVEVLLGSAPDQVGEALASCRLAHLDGRSYIYVRDGDGFSAAWFGQELPSQAVRKVIAGQVAAPEAWNWRTDLHLDRARQTADAVRSHTLTGTHAEFAIGG